MPWVMSGVFLTAEWRWLTMLNYEIEPSVLEPLVPCGTELDRWQGRVMVSVVGFLFLDTRFMRMPIPFHRDFEEVNLRFYVRRKAEDGWRRGVVFVREIVPRAAIALVARKLYHEPYLALPMGHRIERRGSRVTEVEYGWTYRERANSVRVITRGEMSPLLERSEAEFITEHYWGYNGQPDGSTLEYQVEHPRWRIQEVESSRLDCDVAGLYGEQFVDALNEKPASAFLAEGSAIRVYRARKISF